MKTLKRISDSELEKRRLNLQEDLRELIREGSGKSDTFYIKQEELHKIVIRQYKRVVKKTTGVILTRKK